MIDNSWLSILGLYKYDSNIFQNLTIPQAVDLDLTLPYMQDVVTDLDKDVLIFKILMDLAELPLVYTKPDLVKYMIGRWSTSRKPVWTELWKTTLYKYVPIWNKDGTFDETRELETTGETTGSLNDTSRAAHTLTGTMSKRSVTDQDTSEHASGTEDITTNTDQDTTEAMTGTEDVTTTTDEDTTGSSSGTLDRETVTDQDTSGSKSGTTSGTGSLNRTVSHNVTGFDVDIYAPDTQDVTAESTTTSGTSSETDSGTNDVTETVDENTTGSTTGTRNVEEVIDKDVTESKTGTNDVTEVVDREWTENRTGTNDVDVTETGSNSETYSGTGALDRTTGGTSEGSENESIHRVEQGNIGVTTTQQMIREQRDIVMLDMYQIITDEFKKTFCVMLY